MTWRWQYDDKSLNSTLNREIEENISRIYDIACTLVTLQWGKGDLVTPLYARIAACKSMNCDDEVEDEEEGVEEY